MGVNKLSFLFLVSLSLVSCGKRDLKQELGLINDDSYIYVGSIQSYSSPKREVLKSIYPFFVLDSYEKYERCIEEEYDHIKKEADAMNINQQLFENYCLIFDIFYRGHPGDNQLPKDYTFLIGVKFDKNTINGYYHFATPSSNTSVPTVVVWYSTFYFLKKAQIKNLNCSNAYFVQTGKYDNELNIDDLYSNKSIEWY